MKIRKYKSKDKRNLIRLWKEAFPNDPPHNDPSEVIDAKLSMDDLIFVAINDEEVVGVCMAGYDKHRGWLYAVAVTEHRRRNGVGTSLVKHAVNTLKKMGCIKVNVQIRSTNKSVIDFYKRLGFDVEDRVSMGLSVG